MAKSSPSRVLGPHGPLPPGYLSLGQHLEISWAALLLLAWLNYQDSQGVIPLALLACALHEGGHLLALALVGAPLGKIRLTLVGAEMLLPSGLTYGQEILCALAGPGVNLLLAWLVYPWFPLFAGIHLALALVNLLPLAPLDGGRVLGGILRLVCPLAWAEGFLEVLELGLSCLLLFFALILAHQGGSVTLLFLAIWLLWGQRARR